MFHDKKHGPIINAYGILFATGIVAACYYLWFCWRRNGGSEKSYERFIVIEFVAIFTGARLCHCLCYEPDYFLNNITEMLLPVAVDADGGWQFTGYRGLASHGGAVGAMLGVLVYGSIFRQKVSMILDWTAIATPLLGGFIRIGNFMNGEIVGLPTSLPWGVVFPDVDLLPRHPAQIYEALFYFALFAVVAAVYSRCAYRRVRPSFYFGVVVAAVAAFRIAIETLKEVQVPAEHAMPLNLGQLLSIPMMLLGIGVIVNSLRTCRKRMPL